MKKLVPIEQKEVEFYGDELTAVRTDDNDVYVSVRHLCDALGLDTQAQTRRIRRHTVMADGFMVAKMATIKGDRPANWLRVDLVPLWLSGLSIGSIENEDTRSKLERYQRKAAKVLWEAFQQGQLTTEPDFDELLANASRDVVDAYKMALAVVKLARNQIVLEGRLDGHERQIAAHDTRLEDVEEALGLRGEVVTITEDQASQLSQAVKLVAMAYGKQTKRNEFGSVYGQLYRRYSISGYKLLPVNKFQDAMAWLSEWHQSLVGEG